MQSTLTTDSRLAEAVARPFFPTLRNMALISLALLLFATWLRLPPWIATIGGAVPLIWYHIGYLTPRARVGLSQPAIDSVYYFGFLVTIAALGVSALSLALGANGESMQTIAYQFGLGLLATGYAIFARMHLTSISTWTDEQSPEALMDRYLKRTQELVTNVELASVQFATLTSNLMTRTEAVTKHASDTTEKSMLDVARVFDEQLRATLASGNQGLSDLRALVNETSFAQEREALARSVKMTLDCVLHLNKALLELTNRSNENARSSDAARTTLDTLAQTMALLSDRIEQVAGEHGTMVRTVDTFDAVQTQAVKAVQALDGVVDELAGVAGSLGGVGTTFKNLKTLTTKAQMQLDALVVTSSQLEQASEHIARSAQSTHALATGIERVNAALPNLDQRVTELDGQFTRLRTTSATVAEKLQSLPSPAESAITMTHGLRDAVAQLHTVLDNAGAEALRLSGNTTQTVQALERANTLAAAVNGLQDTTSAVNAMLGSVVETASKAANTLAASTEQMQRSVQAATGALERDVQTSSRAASLFTQRLTDVAQGIIDETRKVRTA